MGIITIRSRDNALFKDLRSLSAGVKTEKTYSRLWLEGEHLCQALISNGYVPSLALACEGFEKLLHSMRMPKNIRRFLFSKDLWSKLSTLPSPAKIAFVWERPRCVFPAEFNFGMPFVILDRVQDPGNAGSILRSSAAFGYKQIVALQDTVALFSQKVLRAGMGAHFDLNLYENILPSSLPKFALPLFFTSSHYGKLLHETILPKKCSWIFSNEGRGISNDLRDWGQLINKNVNCVRILQIGVQESINVAAAAAICLHASINNLKSN